VKYVLFVQPTKKCESIWVSTLVIIEWRIYVRNTRRIESLNCSNFRTFYNRIFGRTIENEREKKIEFQIVRFILADVRVTWLRNQRRRTYLAQMRRIHIICLNIRFVICEIFCDLNDYVWKTDQSRDPQKCETQNLISLRRVRYHYTDIQTTNYSETSSQSLLVTTKHARNEIRYTRIHTHTCIYIYIA